MYGYIYKITYIPDGRVYIGLRRASTFDEKYWGSGVKITRAIKKYGKTSFKREVLEWCNNFKELCEREKYWISYYNSTDSCKGFNISHGGQSGDYERTPEIRVKLSKSRLGKKFWHYQTEKQKEILRQRNFNTSREEYHQRNLKSAETRKQKGITYEGGNNPSASRVRCIDTGEEFSCIKEALDKYGTIGISAVCRGVRQKAGGMRWEYIEKQDRQGDKTNGKKDNNSGRIFAS